MFDKMTPKRADIALHELSDDGHEARVKKAVRAYRRNQTPETEAAALAALSELDKNKRTEIRSAARV